MRTLLIGLTQRTVDAFRRWGWKRPALMWGGWWDRRAVARDVAAREAEVRERKASGRPVPRHPVSHRSFQVTRRDTEKWP